MHSNPRKIIPVILVIVIAGLAIWYFTSGRANAETSKLSASGTIEATLVTIAPELGGRVLEVAVQEGDDVDAGDILIQLEDTLLRTQLEQARAALAQAKANYELISTGPTPVQRQASIAAAELELITAKQALDALSDTQQIQAAQAQEAVAIADKALDRASQVLDNMNTAANKADVDAAWASVVLAMDRLERAQEDFKSYEKKPENNVTRALFQAKLADAQKQYDAVVTRYNNLVGTSNQFDLAVAQANVALYQAQLDEARRQYEKVKDGPDPDDIQLAEARLETARARLELAKADTDPEQIALAQAQVDGAQAAVDAIQAQIDKMTIKSPIDGIVLTRSLEPGEVVMPGAPLLTLAHLENLTITVYVPEDRYGAIRLGQEVPVTVDSFPGESFPARVVRIADRAEFTPRNVQTEEGRRTTVFAVELAVKNLEGKLKPGMPADVVFGD